MACIRGRFLDDRNLVRTKEKTQQVTFKILRNIVVDKVDIIFMCMCKDAVTQSSKNCSLQD